MSHSRIFKLQEQYKKEEYKRIQEYEFYDNGFLDGYHDYVTDDTDLMEDYQWLAEGSHGELYTVRTDGSTIGDDKDPLAYLEVDATQASEFVNQRLKEYAEKVAADPKFATSWRGEEMIHGDTGGFYFEVDGWGYMTEFEFLEHVADHYKEGTVTYRLEGTLDYHC